MNNQKSTQVDLQDFTLYKKLIFIFGFFLYLLWVFKSYTGNIHSNNVDLQKFFNKDFPYTFDFVLNNTYYFSVTILYDVLNFFSINLDNDYVGFFIHLLTTSVKGFFLFLIIKKIVKVKDSSFLIIIVFSLMTIGSLLVEGNDNKVSWVSHMNFTPSYFGQIFRFIFLYFLLIENIFALIILSPLMILIGLKSTYFLIGCGVVYSIFYFKNKLKLIWIFAPIISLMFYLPDINQNLNFDDRKFILETMIKWDGSETVFHLQPILNLVLLSISLIIFPIILQSIESKKLKTFSFIVYFFSLINFIFGFIYFKYLYQFFPIPQIGLLSPTRSMETYQLIFWLVFSIYIFKLNIKNINKVIFFASLFLVNLGEKGLIIGCILISLNLIFLFFVKFLKFTTILSNNKNVILLLFFLILSPSIFYLSFKKYKNNFNLYSLKKIQKWTTPSSINEEQINIALRLQNCNDFVFHDPINGHFVRTISGKSRLDGHPIMNIYDINFIKEIEKRETISLQLTDELKSLHQISENTKKELERYNVIILVNKEYSKKFNKNILRDNISNNYQLIYFLKKNEILKFKKNCFSKITLN